VDSTTLLSDTLAALGDSVNVDSIRAAKAADQFGIFHPASTGTGEEVVLENDRLQIGISTKGARPTVIRLKEYSTHNKTPLYLADPDSGNYGFDFFLGNRRVDTRDLYFTSERSGTDQVRLRAATTDPAKFLEITYRLDSVTYFVHTTMRLVGVTDVDPRDIAFQWQLTGLSNEKYRDGELQKSGVYYKYFSDDRNYLSETEQEQLKLEGRTNWVAFKQDFFTVAMISEKGFSSSGSEIGILPLTDSTHTKRYDAKLFFDLERGQEVEVAMKYYLGPNHYGTLRRTEVDQFDRIIDLGWGIFGWMNKWLVIPIFNWLDGWNWNYGIIILVLTIAIKLLLMPLTWKNFISSAKMRALKPEMDAINEKNKDGDALKKQQATMDLYRKAGVNPASGCVPMVVQMPVLYAMFKFFPSSIELRQESFLWADRSEHLRQCALTALRHSSLWHARQPVHHPHGGQHHHLHGDQQPADAAATGHAEHEADDVPLPGDDALLHEQPARRSELLLPAGQRDQHPADDPVQAPGS
jgi:YidC/Oxa1 family membrane protein insertase